MRKPGQRWCKVCHADYQRAWRVAKEVARAAEVAQLRNENERMRELLKAMHERDHPRLTVN